MRVLVLGANGMLGYRLIRSLDGLMEAWGTVRSMPADSFTSNRLIEGVEATRFETVEDAIRTVNPEAVVNCIGIIKQQRLAQDRMACIEINSWLPHRLAALCDELKIRLLHISTDCVFSGRKGSYVESDLTDAEDLYGRTKALGEIDSEGSLTLRTSIIGREPGSGLGLVEWFLRQEGPVRGYSKAHFSGLTTHELSRVIAKVLLDHPGLSGLWHVAGKPIDKCSLLLAIRDAFGLSTPIIPCRDVVVNRTLDGTRFQDATGFVPPEWDSMIEEMATDAIKTERKEILVDTCR